jgi:hypothetical protein
LTKDFSDLGAVDISLRVGHATDASQHICRFGTWLYSRDAN